MRQREEVEGATQQGGAGEEVEAPRWLDPPELSAAELEAPAREGGGAPAGRAGDSRGGTCGGRERGERDEEDVDIGDNKTRGLFCIYLCPLKGYEPK